MGRAIYYLLFPDKEFGWRGYLLPKLVERLGSPQRASASADYPVQANGFDPAAARALLVGVIWAVWNWPGRLLFTEMSIVQLLTDLVPMCSSSVLLAWVTLRSGSMWPAAVGHAMLPACGMLVAEYPLKGSVISLVGPEVTGLIGGIGFTILALVLLFHPRAFGRGKQPVDLENLQAKEHPTLV